MKTNNIISYPITVAVIIGDIVLVYKWVINGEFQNTLKFKHEEAMTSIKLKHANDYQKFKFEFDFKKIRKERI